MTDAGWRNEETRELICGGYFLVVPSPAPDWTPQELVSSPVVSLSDCICPSISALWASRWVDRSEEDRRREAAAFGVGAGELPALLDWFDDSMEAAMGWPNVFRSVWAARWFARRFLGGGSDTFLVGIGVRDEDGTRLLREASPRREDEAPGGILQMVAAGLPPEPGGEELGWEVLGFDHGGFHSWFCNRLEVEVDGELGIRPGELGLIGRVDDAVAVAAFADDDPGVEPGVWLAWELLAYPTALPGEGSGNEAAGLDDDAADPAARPPGGPGG